MIEGKKHSKFKLNKEYETHTGQTVQIYQKFDGYMIGAVLRDGVWWPQMWSLDGVSDPFEKRRENDLI